MPGAVPREGSSERAGEGGEGCFTTVRILRGRPTRVERHAERLRRDAARLGLDLPGRAEIERLIVERAREEPGLGRDGILRIEWSRAGEGPPRLLGTARALDERPSVWRAAIAETTHPGPGRRHNTKQIGVVAYDRARAEARSRALEEVLLFDDGGRLVEGSHTNLLVVTSEGELGTPALELGAVEGIGLAVVRESEPSLRSVVLDRADLLSARELMAVNIVRGLAPIVELDGEAVGDGQPGPWARRLGSLFLEADRLRDSLSADQRP